MTAVGIIARYMTLLADTNPKCAQKDPLTIKRVCRLMLITHMFFLNKNLYSPLSKRIRLGQKTVGIPEIYHDVRLFLDENEHIHAPKEEFNPREFITPEESELIRDVMEAFADWDTDSLWNFIRFVIPPVYYPRNETDCYEVPERCFEVGLEGVELVSRASAEYGERVYVWAKCGDREITPDSVIPVPEFEVIMPKQCDECCNQKTDQE